MLYPRENPADNTLDFACRTCHFTEKASTSCVFRNELRNTVGETAGITQDVSQDPTVGDPNSNIPEFCTLCGQEIFCELCGKESDRGFWLEVPDDNDNEISTGLRTPVSQAASTPTHEHDFQASQQLQQLQLGREQGHDQNRSQQPEPQKE